MSNQTLSDLSHFPADWPEVEILPLAAPTGPVTDEANYASITRATLTTTSRGNVTISSADTSDNPVVNPSWLAKENDEEVAVQAFRRAREIGVATGITVGAEMAPGPHVQTDAAILAYIKETLAPIHHAVGTCKLFLQGCPPNDVLCLRLSQVRWEIRTTQMLLWILEDSCTEFKGCAL